MRDRTFPTMHFQTEFRRIESTLRHAWIVLLVFSTALASTAVAQNARATPLGPGSGKKESQAHSLAVPSGCSPCLWYSGDFDPNSSLSSGEGNAVTPSWGFTQIYVPFVAAPNGTTDKHVEITSVTFTEEFFVGDSITDLDGGYYEFLQGVFPGNAEKIVKNGTCKSMNAVDTGISWASYELYNFTCVLPKPLKVTIGDIYWVNIAPNFTGSDLAYLANVVDVPAPNQSGWGDISYDSFINSMIFGYTFETTTSLLGVLTQFCVAIAGTYVL